VTVTVREVDNKCKAIGVPEVADHSPTYPSTHGSLRERFLPSRRSRVGRAQTQGDGGAVGVAVRVKERPLLMHRRRPAHSATRARRHTQDENAEQHQE
jgi:hypothetical protein